jgi:hypothetical protein
MEYTLKHAGWRFSTTAVLVVLNKLLVIGIAWLWFFYLVLVGWDLHLQRAQPPQENPSEYYESTPDPITKGEMEK